MSDVISYSQPRMIAVRGARNFRDLGGYPTEDGRTVRYGVAYRAGHPGDLCETGIAEFAALGIGAIVDLRTTEEREHLPYPARALGNAHYWACDYALSRGDIVAMLKDCATTADDMRERMRSNYRQLPDEQHAAINATLQFLLEGMTPVLINCTAGKDRTGVVAAIVLAALGVSTEVISHDYAYTEVVQDPGQALFHYDRDGPFAYLLDVDPEVMRAMMGSHPENIAAMRHELVTRHGSMEGYLLERHDLDEVALRGLRARMLEG
ncbi:tyrosine-protein phosphatase [Novosphingobium sp. ERN07]|uniref:tyrosine-protein phosphatase n=1 Tax=Novosphingobium sp. ERN07 TaxID=2726187 RepID=UPI0014574FB0|nr:tyrosine-protein phosphatase [Novosphingobium sp. ERN07]